MKLQETTEQFDGCTIFTASFEPNQTNGTHEAFVAVHAIGAKSRASFDEHQKEKGPDRLKMSMGLLLNSGIDKFASELQRLAREKMLAGILQKPVVVKAINIQFDYLYEALAGYRDATPDAVVNEMRTAMGDTAGLERGFEAVTADNMMAELDRVFQYTETGKLDPNFGGPNPEPYGFARALVMESHEA